MQTRSRLRRKSTCFRRDQLLLRRTYCDEREAGAALSNELRGRPSCSKIPAKIHWRIMLNEVYSRIFLFENPHHSVTSTDDSDPVA